MLVSFDLSLYSVHCIYLHVFMSFFCDCGEIFMLSHIQRVAKLLREKFLQKQLAN